MVSSSSSSAECATAHQNSWKASSLSSHCSRLLDHHQYFHKIDHCYFLKAKFDEFGRGGGRQVAANCSVLAIAVESFAVSRPSTSCC